LYRSIFDVVRDFLHDEALEGQDRMLNKYLKPDLLIVDDMGMKNLPKRSGEFLFEIIMRRYETRSTMMTSNRPLEDWGRMFSLLKPGGLLAVMTQLLAEHKCLSEVLYYEARGEGAGGQKAIAEVVFHRMNHGDYGHSICAVVYEGANRSGCQFSFTCNGDMKRAKQPGAWRESEKLAAQILTGQVALKNATGGALNFHAVSVSPDWADTMDRTTQIGNHIFYRGMQHMRDS